MRVKLLLTMLKIFCQIELVGSYHILSYHDNFEGNNYKLFSTPKHIYDAKETCHGDMAKLARFQSVDVLQYLFKTYGSGRYWIGEDNDGCHMMDSDGKKSLVNNCLTKALFICQRKGMLSRFNWFNGNRYEYFSDLSSWLEAIGRCEIYGGQLAIDNSSSIHNYMRNTFQSEYWIGLKADHMLSVWSHINGRRVEHPYWDGRQPYIDHSSPDRCAAMSDGGWRNYPCQKKCPFLCEMKDKCGPYSCTYDEDQNNLSLAENRLLSMCSRKCCQSEFCVGFDWNRTDGEDCFIQTSIGESNGSEIGRYKARSIFPSRRGIYFCEFKVNFKACMPRSTQSQGGNIVGAVISGVIALSIFYGVGCYVIYIHRKKRNLNRTRSSAVPLSEHDAIPLAEQGVVIEPLPSTLATPGQPSGAEAAMMPTSQLVSPVCHKARIIAEDSDVPPYSHEPPPPYSLHHPDTGGNEFENVDLGEELHREETSMLTQETQERTLDETVNINAVLQSLQDEIDMVSRGNVGYRT